MEKFSEILLSLESADHIQRIEFHDTSGQLCGKIENKPGTQGSLKVYFHLFKTFGRISQDAAVEGLALFGEYTEDAESSPGKHPNVDRLFDVLDDDEPLTVSIIEKTS